MRDTGSSTDTAEDQGLAPEIHLNVIAMHS